MLQWSILDEICEVQLDYAPCNEIGTEMLVALESFLERFDPSSARALILRSGLESGFSAGADLRELHSEIVSRPGDDLGGELRCFLDRVHSVMDRLDALPVATICVVHGVCFGGGFELALTCDVRIAERSARFAFPELRLGIIPGFGGIPRLERDVGGALVRDLLFSGRSLNARRALEMGLVSQLVPVGRGAAAALSLARQASRFDPETLRAAKAFAKPIPRERLDDEKEVFLRLFDRPQVLAALEAFVESDDLRPYIG